jgi:hypothetical protein
MRQFIGGRARRQFIGACLAAMAATVGTLLALAGSVAVLVLIVYLFQR